MSQNNYTKKLPRLGKIQRRVLASMRRKRMRPCEIAKRAELDYSQTLKILGGLKDRGAVNAMLIRRRDGTGWARGRLWYRR